MKKFFLASALTMATVSSVTATTKHGFYVGAGLSALAGHHDAVLNYQEGALNPQANSSGFSKYVLGGDIMVGYMAMINNFVVGAEVDYMFGNINKTNLLVLDNNTRRTTKVDSTGGAWGVGVRLGYHCLERMMPYLRLGIETRRFKLFHNSEDLDALGVNVVSFNEISATSRKTAFTPGVGMEFKLNSNLILGLEYRHAFYGSIKKSGYNTAQARTVDFRVKPRVSTGILSLKYVWGA